MKITHACNLTCAHCPFWKKKAESLSFTQAISALRALHQRGVRILIIEGGEPLIWRDGERDLNDVIDEAKKLFFSVGVTTNGTFPIDLDSDVVWVSIDGLRETHDRVRGETFDRIIANIEASSHPKIFAHITINSLNCQEVPELVKFLSAAGASGRSPVQGITIQFHYPYEGLSESKGDDLFLPFDRRKHVLDELITLKKQGFPVADSYACLNALKDNRWECRPWMIASVDPSGKLTEGCYVKGRGAVSCEHCGFAAHTEISLAYGGVLGAILAGRRIFG
ncbi:MAG: radical SAM protein [Planctomycetota bacterium]